MLLLLSFPLFELSAVLSPVSAVLSSVSAVLSSVSAVLSSKMPGRRLSGSTTRAASTRMEKGMFALCFGFSYRDTVGVIVTVI